MFSEPIKCVSPRVHLKNNASKCPNIRCWQRYRFLKHLWRNIKRRAHKRVPSNDRLVIHDRKKSWFIDIACDFARICLLDLFPQVTISNFRNGFSRYPHYKIIFFFVKHLELIYFIFKLFCVSEINLR